jgi:hypothetical protein
MENEKIVIQEGAIVSKLLTPAKDGRIRIKISGWGHSFIWKSLKGMIPQKPELLHSMAFSGFCDKFELSRQLRFLQDFLNEEKTEFVYLLIP